MKFLLMYKQKFNLNIIFFHIRSPLNVEERDERTAAQYYIGSDSTDPFNILIN